MSRPATTMTLLLLLSAAAQGQTRVALVTGLSDDSTRNLIVLAEARLNDEKEIALVERGQIDRLLGEQKLLMSGLIDAEEAMKLGGIIPADLLAVVDGDPRAKRREAFGLVVFDAKTGVRYWDRAVPAIDGRAAAELIASGIRAAVSKHNVPPEQRPTVCIVMVRNADLPPEMDAAGHAVALLIERRLACSPRISVLERSRLEHLLTERGIAAGPADAGLATSLRLIELEIGRAAAPDSVYAKVIVTDSRRRRVTTRRAAGESLDAALAHRLALSLEAFAGVDAPAPAADDDAHWESYRFRQESWRLQREKRTQAAVHAAESAYALRPNSWAHKALVNALMGHALESLPPTTRATLLAERASTLIESDAALRSLTAARRSIALRHDYLLRSTARSARELDNHLFLGSSMYLNNTQQYARRWIDLHCDDPAVAAQLVLLRQQIAEHHLALLSHYARLSATDPVAHQRHLSFLRFWPELFATLSRDMNGQAQYINAALREVLAVLALPRERTLGLKEAHVLNGALVQVLSPTSHLWFDYRSRSHTRHWPAWQELDRLRFLAPLAAKMRGHRHPIVRLYGELAALRTSILDRHPFDRHESLATVEQQVAALLEAPATALRIQSYIAWHDAIAIVIDDEPARFDHLLALCRHMLENQTVVPQILSTLTDLAHRDASRREAVAACVRQALHLAQEKPPGSLLAENRWDYPLQLQRELERWSLPPSTPSPPPWEQATRLVALRTTDGLDKDMAFRPRQLLLDGDRAWTLAISMRGDRPRIVRLIALPIAGGDPILLAPIEIPFTYRFGGSVYDPDFPALCRGPQHLFVAIWGRGVYAFPLDGSPPARITREEGLPNEEVTAMAYFDASLYLGIGDARGYLVRFDLPSGPVHTLASSQRLDGPSPLDGVDALTIHGLIADPPRNRVIASVQCRYPHSSRHPLAGLWQIDHTTGKLRQILQFYKCDFRFEPHPGEELVLALGHWSTWIYNMATGERQVVRLWDDRADGAGSGYGDQINIDEAGIKSLLTYTRDQAVVGDHLWCASPFTRIHTKTQAVQSLPALPTGEPEIDSVRRLLRTPDGRSMIVLHNNSVWRLDLPTEEPAP